MSVSIRILVVLCIVPTLPGQDPAAMRIVNGGGESRLALTREGAPSVAGYCVLWVVFEHAFIQNVAVHPRHRRCGLATLLVERAIDEARDGGAESVTLDARRSRP